MPVKARFMTVKGKFRTLKEETFPTTEDAFQAVEKFYSEMGLTNIKLVDDKDYSDNLRVTAKTVGGRSGRNIAFLDMECDETNEPNSAHYDDMGENP